MPTAYEQAYRRTVPKMTSLKHVADRSRFRSGLSKLIHEAEATLSHDEIGSIVEEVAQQIREEQ